MNVQMRDSDLPSSRAGSAKCAKARRGGFPAGVTLTEAMVSMVIVAVVAVGGLSYEYLAAKHSLIAHAQTAATRTAQLLLEDWKCTGGSPEYDPTSLGLGFSSVTLAAADASVSTLGPYAIEVDGLPMMVTLEYYDVAYDEEAEVTLRRLDVVASFAQVNTELTQADPWMGIRPVVLTTYVRVDAAGG